MSHRSPLSIPPEWQTPAEKTGYRETPTYAETVSYARRLEAASPVLRYESFGKSGQGLDLPLLIAASGNAFEPELAHQDDRAVVLIQACIHAGEPDGKDAGLALLRDITISNLIPGLLDKVVVLFIPIYNADGHERSSPFNRINQNGPAEMGWRTTSTYHNLNRDYMKADTPETRAWLKLWNRWQPHLFIDCHVTDGADYQYNITYQHEHHAGVPPTVLAWEKAIIQERVATATEAAGNLISWYLEFKDNRDLTKGILDFNGSPRFSTGYTPLRNRPGILIETHMLKDYRSRVLGTYDFLRFTLEEVGRDPTRLRDAVREAEYQTVTAGRSCDASLAFPLDFELTSEARPYELKAIEYDTTVSEISGVERVVYGTQPLQLTVPMYDNFRVKRAITPPLSYIVPVQWEDVVDVLKAHGVEMEALSHPIELDVESYKFIDVTWPAGPFEGRFMPNFSVQPVIQRRAFPAGSVVIALAQACAKVAINLLEPLAPDSLARWGFFNSIFEQKEYAEYYVLEKLARDMISENPDLRKEFEDQLASDDNFARSADSRLKFFYKRSPYWDQEMNLYPVGRITIDTQLKR